MTNYQIPISKKYSKEEWENKKKIKRKSRVNCVASIAQNTSLARGEDEVL